MNLDKFYTKSEVAQKCIDSVIKLAEFNSVIEPSAGSGAFSSRIEGCIAFDIEPEYGGIEKADFLRIEQAGFGRKLFIGNPPFGARSSLAKKFIAKSIELGADTIAFILPKTFLKYSNQKIFDEKWRLVKIVELSEQDNHFLITDGEYYVPCCFFVWTKSGDILPDVNLRKKNISKSVDFKFMPRGSQEADFALNGNNGKIKPLSRITNPKAEHYIRVLDRNRVNEVRDLLADTDFHFASSVNGGVSWIGQYEIIEGYLNHIDKVSVKGI